MFGRVEETNDFFAASLNKTLHEVFSGVRLHSNGDGAIFFAASDRSPLDFVHPPNLEGVHPSVQSKLSVSYHNLVQTNPNHGRVLTDNYNPVEFYDAANREEVRRSLVGSSKRLFEPKL
jgi:hypothetical protein